MSTYFTSSSILLSYVLLQLLMSVERCHVVGCSIRLLLPKTRRGRTMGKASLSLLFSSLPFHPINNPSSSAVTPPEPLIFSSCRAEFCLNGSRSWPKRMPLENLIDRKTGREREKKKENGRTAKVRFARPRTSVSVYTSMHLYWIPLCRRRFLLLFSPLVRYLVCD